MRGLSMLSVARRYLPHILVTLTLVSFLGVGYAMSTAMSSNNQLKVQWTPNPVTINIPEQVGTGSAMVSLTCNQVANDLVLTPQSPENKITLTVSPSTVPVCSSVPTLITLTANCQANECAKLSGKHVIAQVLVTQPYNNYNNGTEVIPVPLKVIINIVPSDSPHHHHHPHDPD